MFNPDISKVTSKTEFNKLVKSLRHSGIKGHPNNVDFKEPEKYPAMVAMNRDDHYGNITIYGTWIYQF